MIGVFKTVYLFSLVQIRLLSQYSVLNVLQTMIVTVNIYGFRRRRIAPLFFGCDRAAANAFREYLSVAS